MTTIFSSRPYLVLFGGKFIFISRSKFCELFYVSPDKEQSEAGNYKQSYIYTTDRCLRQRAQEKQNSRNSLNVERISRGETLCLHNQFFGLALTHFLLPERKPSNLFVATFPSFRDYLSSHFFYLFTSLYWLKLECHCDRASKLWALTHLPTILLLSLFPTHQLSSSSLSSSNFRTLDP